MSKSLPMDLHLLMSDSTATSQNPWSLSGKTAVVTGGSRGIGRGIAIHLVRKGLSNLAITYVANKAAAEETLERCRSLGVQRAIMIQADMTDHSVGPKVINEALAGLETQTIDILVNNAILGNTDKPRNVAETTPEDFAEMMHANVYSPVSLTIAMLPHVPARGGRVINISSVAGRVGNRDPLITYGASKAALESFTRSLADQYSTSKGMTFNSVTVGATNTDALQAAKNWAAFPSDFLDQAAKDSTVGRIGEPEDIGYIVGFLASEEGRWVNGAAVSAHGGIRAILGN
ncbi:short chain oxidoreductase [Colletotrichum plurivorum]|uniref:Short chain oxidoreductase n=1 Tax=Colletotrichum plurivorum TaxID=2175906 RepID=A0A8H6NGQ4_9PEZI|nr:short chain oxidoreductase [Colletotrichum plurivorum]